jgi:large subunit ribosomal protein L13
MEKSTTREVRFDASGENLGRLAVRIADTLRGKNTPEFQPNRVPNKKVVVFNTDKLALSPQKQQERVYYRHSGYPGGLAAESMERLFARDSREVVRRAVYGMLPKNKLRDPLINNLKLFKEDAE